MYNLDYAKNFLSGKRQTHSVKNSIILVLTLLCLSSVSVACAQQKISGIVLGEDSSRLAGATIYIHGSEAITSSLTDGSFSINAKPGDIIEISFVGFESKNLSIKDYSELKIVLSFSALTLDDVVMVGYTSQRVKDITGSVAIVKPKDITSIPAGQLEQMLQGRVAGLTVINSAIPGVPGNVRLHGLGNFGDVTPLYIIDGVQGNINNLNPNDIESIQVLKDAGAYSIYGVRGGNGVIVITTRSGKQGRSKVNYDFYIGTTTPVKNNINLLNPQEMADLRWIVLENSNQALSDPLFGNGPKPVLPDFFIAGENAGLSANDPLADPGSYNIDFSVGDIHQIVQANKTGTDWFHELYKPALSQSHSLTVSGANERNKYVFSLGYMDQQGTLLSTFLKRFTIRVNTEFNVANIIRFGENLQMSYRTKGNIPDYGNPTDNDMLRAITTHPMLPVYDIKNGWAHFVPRNFFDNPVALRVNAKDDKNHTWETFGNFFAEIDFLKGFTFRSCFGGNITNYNFSRFDYWTYYPTNDSLPDNALMESSGYHWSWTWTNTLKFSKKIGADHTITALAGIEAIENYDKEIGGRSTGLYSNSVNYRFLSNGTPNGVSWAAANYSFAGASSLYSLMSQADYNFKDKVLFRATLRRDGVSFFGPRNKYGLFPSVSAAWRIVNENFLSGNRWIDELKLRVSWGKTGFYGNTNPFNQYTLYGGSFGDAYYDINGNNRPVQGFRTVRLGDPATGWQEDIVTNIGFESVLWKGKLSATIDWYNKKAKGLLFPVLLPDILGGATPPNVNIGEVQNKGFDILLGTRGRFNTEWRWETTATISFYENKILKIPGVSYSIPDPKIAAGYVRNAVNHPMSSFYGYRIIGIFKNTNEVDNAASQDGKAPGRFRYADVNNDMQIDAADRVFLGDANPDLTLGFNFTIGYKNLDLSAFFYGSFGNQVINIPRTYLDFYPTGYYSAKSDELLYDSWTPQHTNTTIPIAETNNNFSNTPTDNSYLVEDGSYFRNRSLILGYNFSNELLNKIKIDKLRIYIQAMNLFTITSYKGLDPELPGASSAFGIDFGSYPNNEKRFLAGISLNF